MKATRIQSKNDEDARQSLIPGRELGTRLTFGLAEVLLIKPLWSLSNNKIRSLERSGDAFSHYGCAVMCVAIIYAIFGHFGLSWDAGLYPVGAYGLTGDGG